MLDKPQRTCIIPICTFCILSIHRDGQIERLDEQRRQLVLSHERYVEELTSDFERKLDEERQARLQLEVGIVLLL
jgi:hypothetical protein